MRQLTFLTKIFLFKADKVGIYVDTYFDGRVLVDEEINPKSHSQRLAFHLHEKIKDLFEKRSKDLWKKAPRGYLSTAMIQFKDDEKKGVLIDFTLGGNRKPGAFEVGVHGVEDIKDSPAHYFALIFFGYILSLKSLTAKKITEGTPEDFGKNCKEFVESSIGSLFKANNDPLF